MNVMKLNLEHVTSRTRKNGSRRYYFRRRGCPIIRLPDDYKSPEFMAAYQNCLNSLPHSGHREKGTFAWLCDQYMESTAFKGLKPATIKARSRIIKTMCLEKINPEHSQLFADTKITSFKKAHIAVLRDRKFNAPNAANERLKILNVIFKHAVITDLLDHSPCFGVEKLSVPRGGHKTASDEHLSQYLAYHTSGPAKRAMALLMATGVRVSDLRLLGKPNLKGTTLTFTTVKTHMLISIDIDHDFAEELRKTNHITFLISNHGGPYKSDKSMSQAVSNWFKEAGIEGITAHSVRKWLATRMASNGVNEFGLMAWFGWRDSKEAKPYIEAYNRQKAANEAGRIIANV